MCTLRTGNDIKLYILNKNEANLYKDSKWRHLVNVVFNEVKQYVQRRLNLACKTAANVSHQIANDFLRIHDDNNRVHGELSSAKVSKS